MITEELIKNLMDFKNKVKTLESKSLGNSKILLQTTRIDTKVNRIIHNLLKISTELTKSINKS